MIGMHAPIFMVVLIGDVWVLQAENAGRDLATGFLF